MPTPLVEINDLTKSYGGFVAVDSVSLTIPSGCVYALLGLNGAGKTTVMRLLMGMLQPARGTLRIGGLDAFRDSVAVKPLIGYVPDEPSFYDYLRGREIIGFCGEMRGLPRRVIAERSALLAERLQLTEALDEFAENYSRGMKKKLGLICALLHEPRLLILDEPANGLDPQGSQTMQALIRESAEAGRSVLFSTHLLDQAERLCQQAAILHAGRVAAAGTLDDLRRQAGTAADARLEDVFFRLTGASPAAELSASELPASELLTVEE